VDILNYYCVQSVPHWHKLLEGLQMTEWTFIYEALVFSICVCLFCTQGANVTRSCWQPC